MEDDMNDHYKAVAAAAEANAAARRAGIRPPPISTVPAAVESLLRLMPEAVESFLLEMPEADFQRLVARRQTSN
jgi:hypothetical protein